MFLQRSASFLDSSNSLTASWVVVEISIATTRKGSRVPSSSGDLANPALARLRSLKVPVSTISSPPLRSLDISTLSAAGFIATSTSKSSPDVMIRLAPKLIWNDETPNVVPTGARISAGKSGNVARSLPASAVASVNCPPVNCMPSPLSPAKRTTAVSNSSRVDASAGALNA
jgi:hypothetical protein